MSALAAVLAVATLLAVSRMLGAVANLAERLHVWDLVTFTVFVGLAVAGLTIAAVFSLPLALAQVAGAVVMANVLAHLAARRARATAPRAL